MKMDDVELESPFKSPSACNIVRSRRSPGSGSSRGSSVEKVSPLRSLNTSSCGNGSINNGEYLASPMQCDRNGENDCPTSASSGGSGGGEQTRVNPFEKDVLAGLQRSFWSPSIMDITETPPQRTWAIEHLSHLFPKDIENSPSTHQNSFQIDEQMEAKAQADIDSYFSKGPIVPTPSPVATAQCSGTSLFSKVTMPHLHTGHSPITRVPGIVGSGMGLSLMLKKKKLVPIAEKWTQTALSFPPKLPEHIEDILSQYCLGNGELCGEPEMQSSQKSDSSEHAEGADNNDSGKNSSLNVSLRRRLELSFGEDPEGDEGGLSQEPVSPILDPFRLNHRVNTPPCSKSRICSVINTTTSDLEVQFMRCEFTPEARGIIGSRTPGITPIQDEPDDDGLLRLSCSTTPRRTTGNAPSSSKRWSRQESTAIPVSLALDNNYKLPRVLVTSHSEGGGAENPRRRSRTSSPQNPLMKTSQASSFEDFLFSDDCSPPSKVYRRTSENS